MPLSFPELAPYVAVRKGLVDTALDARLPAADVEPVLIHQAMRYATLSGGKRLRPLFTLAVADLAASTPESVLDAACAVELAHTASLILDDLPCMDDALQRRGQACLHVRYGEATAILASMGLLTQAFDLVARNAAELGRPDAAAAATQALARAIGSAGLVYGQHLDLTLTGGRPNQDQIECIHQHKAGTLFVAAVELPGLLLGLDSTARGAVRTYAEHIGLAFQIIDDLRDALDASEDAGKATFATHLGPNGARRRAQALLTEAGSALAPFGARARLLHQLVEHVRAGTTS